MIAGVPVAIEATDFVDRIRPERAGLRFLEPFLHTRRVEFVAATPAAPVGFFGCVQAVVDEAEEARRVALHEVFGVRVLCAERALVVADVPVEPVIVHEAEVSAGEAGVEIVAADAAPGGVVIGAARVDARAGDVEEIGKRLADPRPAIVLIGDGVDAEFGDELCELLRASG